MKKKKLLWLWALILAAGCAAGEPEKGGQSAAPSSGQVSVASFEGTDVPVPKSSFNRMVGGTLYYLDSQWNDDTRGMVNSSIWKLEREDGEPELAAEFGEAQLLLFFVDEAQALYCLYTMPGEGGERYFFRKQDAEGSCVYDKEVSYQGTPGGQGVLARLGTAAAGEADGEGRACLAGTQGDLYFFDPEGTLVRMGSAPWTGDSCNGADCRLANAGEDGIYVCVMDGKRVTIRKADMEEGTLGTAVEVPASEMEEVSLELYSGYTSGLLLSDGAALWAYRPGAAELVRLLEWGGKTVSLRDHIINAVGVLPDGSLFVAAHQPGQEMSLIHIESRELSEVPQRETAVLAVKEEFQEVLSYLIKATEDFNRRSTEYQVEIFPWNFSFDLEAELLKGGGPDLFCLGELGMDIRPLAAKGVLEDLAPWFAGSSIVREEELVPAVREAGTIDGKFLCVIPDFSIQGILTSAGTTEGGRWTAQDYVALGEATPELPLESVSSLEYYHSSVLQSALRGEMEYYVDWEARECHFDSEEFISLLERISRLPAHGNEGTSGGHGLDAELERVSGRELLTASWSTGDKAAFARLLDAVRPGASVESAGYPSRGEEPHYGLFALEVLGINSASRNKEAAWAFLEFLLSEEVQGELETSLPARKSAFDQYLDREKDSYGRDTSLSEEQKEQLRYIVDRARWMAAANTEDILYIISEEASAVWAGDRTAGQAAVIIQNRVALYLNEQGG